MLLVGLAVHVAYPNDWRPVEAIVKSARIESVRVGTLQWVLRADASYGVDGRTFETTADVARDTDRAVLETEIANWHSGRKTTLYYDAGNPRSVSTIADGGREATVVTAVMLTPLAVSFAALLGYVLRGRFQSV